MVVSSKSSVPFGSFRHFLPTGLRREAARTDPRGLNDDKTG
jgi:hypothetical protein